MHLTLAEAEALRNTFSNVLSLGAWSQRHGLHHRTSKKGRSLAYVMFFEVVEAGQQFGSPKFDSLTFQDHQKRSL